MATGQSSYSSTSGTTYFDLTQDTGDRAAINGALLFQNKPDSSSGTGLIQAIVRVQDPGSGDGFENGYNSSARPVSYEENTSPNFTTSLLLSEVPKVTINGVQYYEFRLDINQENNASLLSLDAVKIYTSDVDDGQATGLITGAWFTDNATLRYNMDGAGNTSVLLDASLSSGSGSSDLFFYVPVSNFGAVDPDDTYVTLYSEFGAANVLDGADGITPLDDPANVALGDSGDDTGDVATAIFGTYLANDGFEEWSVSKQTGGVISGYKWADADGDGVWDAGETGLGGFTIDYSISYDAGHGNNVQHVVVDGSVTTSDGTQDVDGDGIIDPLGFYSIAVPASSDKNETYTITLTEQAEAGYVNTYDGDATANSTTTFNFSSNDLTTTGAPGEPASPDISGHFGVTETMNFGNRLLAPHITIDKVAVIRDGGDCVDDVDDVVDYTVTVTNDGEIDLTNVVLTDSFEGGTGVTITGYTGDDDDGDATNGLTPDGILQVGETWTYTYTHDATQDDIDSNGGDDDGTLDNVATVDADSANGSVTDNDDASVDVCQLPDIAIDKTAVIRDGGDCVDDVDDVVDYTVTVTNTGNVSLENVVLTDSFEGGPDVTITGYTGDDDDGDATNGLTPDGILQVGEIWTYTYTHDATQDDIDSNGGDDDGTLDNVATVTADVIGASTEEVTDNDDASVDVCQLPALSIDKTAVFDDGSDCADTVDELVNYTVTLTNTGNVSLENVVLTDSFEGGLDVTITGYTGDDDDGDATNGLTPDGILQVGEVWTYTYTHAVTQEDIDSNGYGNGTLDNIATANADAVTSGEAAAEVTDDASVDVCQLPALSIDKTAVFEDGSDCADTVDELVNYTVTLTNTGNVSLENVVLTDSFEGGLDVTITGYTGDDDDGDATNGLTPDGILQVGEVWTYTYTHAVTQEDIDSNGYGNGTLDNIATANADAVTSGEAAAEVTDDASVDVCQDESITLVKNVRTDTTAGLYVAADDPTGPVASTGMVDFQVIVTNNGNVSLENVTLSDTVDHNAVETDEAIDYNLIGAEIDIDNDGIIDGLWSDYDEDQDGTLDDADGNFATVDDFILAPGASFAVYYSLDPVLGQHENTAVVTADAATTGTDVTAEDDANYYVVESEDCVGVRTPGFWQNNKWGLFWNFDPTKPATATDQDALPQNGTPGFATGELLYAIDTSKNGVVDGGDTNNAGLLIGDYNMNGITDAGEDTIFISLSDAKALINASNKNIGDGKTADGIWMLGRDVVATWLNYLANNQESDGGLCVGDVDSGDGTNTPREFLDAAIDWLQQFAATDNGANLNQNLANTYHDGDEQAVFQFDARIAPSSAAWQNPFTVGEAIPVSAAAMHSALDGYNNTGMIAGVEYCCDADSQLVISVLSQIDLI